MVTPCSMFGFQMGKLNVPCAKPAGTHHEGFREQVSFHPSPHLSALLHSCVVFVRQCQRSASAAKRVRAWLTHLAQWLIGMQPSTGPQPPLAVVEEAVPEAVDEVVGQQPPQEGGSRVGQRRCQAPLLHWGPGIMLKAELWGRRGTGGRSGHVRHRPDHLRGGPEVAQHVVHEDDGAEAAEVGAGGASAISGARPGTEATAQHCCSVLLAFAQSQGAEGLWVPRSLILAMPRFRSPGAGSSPAPSGMWQ